MPARNVSGFHLCCFVSRGPIFSFVQRWPHCPHVQDFHQPHQLREMMDHCLYVDDKPRDLEQLLSDCKETLKYCVKTGAAFVSIYS